MCGETKIFGSIIQTCVPLLSNEKSPRRGSFTTITAYRRGIMCIHYSALRVRARNWNNIKNAFFNVEKKIKTTWRGKELKLERADCCKTIIWSFSAQSSRRSIYFMSISHDATLFAITAWFTAAAVGRWPLLLSLRAVRRGVKVIVSGASQQRCRGDETIPGSRSLPHICIAFYCFMPRTRRWNVEC